MCYCCTHVVAALTRYYRIQHNSIFLLPLDERYYRLASGSKILQPLARRYYRDDVWYYRAVGTVRGYTLFSWFCLSLQVASWHESVDSFLWYLFPFSKHPNDDVLLLVGMSLMFACWKFILYNKKILVHVLCFEAKILLYIYDFLLDILFVPSCNHFVCTSFFVDIYHHDCLLLRIFYT